MMFINKGRKFSAALVIWPILAAFDPLGQLFHFQPL